MKSIMNISLSILMLVIIFIIACQKLDDSKLQTTPSFQMMNNLIGTIQQSSDKKEIGKKVSFIDLNSTMPEVLLESGMTTPLQIIYNTDETMTLQCVAKWSGSTDTFIIDKKTGKFARASAGSFLGVYATASLGTLK